MQRTNVWSGICGNAVSRGAPGTTETSRGVCGFSFGGDPAIGDIQADGSFLSRSVLYCNVFRASRKPETRISGLPSSEHTKQRLNQAVLKPLYFLFHQYRDSVFRQVNL